VHCYVAPTINGHVTIWINGQIPKVTSEIRAAVESIIHEQLYGAKRAKPVSSDLAKPTGKYQNAGKC
jgi:hypothetical protein